MWNDKDEQIIDVYEEKDDKAKHFCQLNNNELNFPTKKKQHKYHK